MQNKRNPFILWLIGLIVAALVLTEMVPMFVSAAELRAETIIPTISVENEVTPLLLAQNQQPRRRRKTLMDLLFGGEEEQAPVVVEAPAAPVEATLPPAKPEVEKLPGATRLAVFGDSMAVDLYKALERLFAEDPNIVVLDQGVGSSGFVRQDFFDWNTTISEQIAANSFDIAVMFIGINDRQTMDIPDNSYKALTPEWTTLYSARVTDFVTQLRNAGKPIIWVGLPPMEQPSYATAISQISELQKLAAFAGGAEFLDIYERFVNEEGKYSTHGPDLNGKSVRMRKDDGIHLSAAGADKLAFYLSQTLKIYYRGGGGVGVEVADALAGTDAQLMLRPPYQGLGQMKLLEVAGAVISLTHTQKRSADLITAETIEVAPATFDMDLLIEAPVGRADDFGVGKRPASENPRGR